MKLPLDTGLAAELDAHPEFTQPPPPCPEGVPLGDHLRGLASILLAGFGQSFADRLPPDSKYTVKDYTVPVKDGEITVRAMTPTSSDERATYPVLVWYHGGGWVVGDRTMDDNHFRVLSVALQLTIVNVDYRLAPEFQFPTAHEDCFAALKWVVNHAGELKASLSKGFLVGGDSAGGNLAAVMALQARDDPFFSATPLTGQYLREPVALHPEAAPEKYKAVLRSYEENADAPLLNKEGMYAYFAMYNGPPADVRLSPVLATSHAGLPPAYFQCMECDPLRDEGLLYERLLRESGCTTKLILHRGCSHATHYFFPHIAASAKIIGEAQVGLEWLLSFTKSA
ncbi:alpha/beta-hydrolase [Daedaleopsis nitida]|nr:alpha/beta-hydrolase [Daedaleopsis nitida]